MYKIILIQVIFLFFQVYGMAEKKPKYKASDIPEDMTKNALAVVRNYEQIFTLHSIKSANLSIKYAITVLDKNGSTYAQLNEYYDKLNNIKEINAIIYDQNGEVLEKVKNSEIKDYSAVSGFSLYEDNRRKFYNPDLDSYPYTIEYEYEFEYVGLFNFPVWQPILGYNISVEHSSFKVVVPKDEAFRYYESNIDDGVKLNDDDKNETYFWEVLGITAIEKEDHSPNLFEFTPVVYTAPTSFEIEGYKGNMESWEKFGQWVNQLNEGRDILPEETKAELDELVSGITDKYEITRKIYDYVQSHTRYVSIQEGIGGWQPFSADVVAKTGYGDCKALTNYTYALLKHVGITSHYTKVRAGRNAPNFRKDFVSNQSNHVFLCVPIENDTVWLECTSQTNPFGYIGNFTDDRDVMLITDNGGEVVHTKVYSQEENTQICTANVKLDEDNNCAATVSISFSGLQYDNISNLLNKSYEDQEKWLYNVLDLSNLNITQLQFNHISDIGPQARMEYNMDITSYASGSGKRIFLPLNLLNQTTYVPPRNSDRKTNVVLNFPFVDVDTIKFTLPEGYNIESSPENCEYKTRFGEYSSSIEIHDRNVIYIRNRRMKKGVFPAETYVELRAFYKNISKADKAKLVLVQID